MAKRATTKKKTAPAPDELDRLVAEVNDRIEATDIAEFTDYLKAEHGLKITQNRITHLVQAKMAGIEGASAVTNRQAIMNWANAARRHLSKAAA